MSTNNNAWMCSKCEDGCGEATNSFGSLLCIYEYFTCETGSDQDMWFKEHSPQHRELISTNGKVIAIWRSSQNVWRERTAHDDFEDFFVSGYETGEKFIEDEGGAFNLALSIR